MIILFKILAAVALVTAILAGLYKAEKHIEGIGYDNGIAAQKAEDQPKFDKFNADIARNKLEAAALLAKANADIVAGLAREDEFKATLEKAREINRTEVDALRRKYAATGLRFAAPASPQTAGCGNGGGSTGGAETKTASVEATTIVQLPDKITGDLRQLVIDADNLKVEYAACYAYVNRDE